MSEKIKAVRGNKERAEEVKKWLINHGATYLEKLGCNNEDYIYFVNPNGEVDYLMNYEYLFDVEELPLWRAKCDEEYWYIDDDIEVRCTTEELSRKDDARYVGRNYFKTEGEAEEYCSKIEKLLEERK